MPDKPTYEELQQKIKDLEKEIAEPNRARKNIAKKRTVEEALRESEERYRLVVENANEAIVVFQDGHPKFFNPKALEMTGHTAEEYSKLQITDHLHPDDRDWVVDIHRRRMAGEEVPESYEFRIKTKHGQTRWLYVNPVTVDWKGRPASLDFFTDITESKQAEELLHKSEKKYRTILGNITDGYYEADLAGNLTFVNDSVCEITGRPRDELLDMNYRDYTDQETAGVVYQTFNQVYTTGKAARNFEYEIRLGKDAPKKDIEISVSLITDEENQPTGFRGIMRDVTERKRMERELIESKSFLENIFNSSIDGITTTDLHGNIIYTSPKVKNILGFEPNEIMGKKACSFYADGKEDAKVIMRELTAKSELASHEMKMRKKNGELIDILTSTAFIKNENGQIVGTLGIYKDITEKKKLDAQLQNSRRMETIITLAGGVAHKFNNALASITGNIDLLEMDHPYDADMKEQLKAMKESAYHMTHLTRQLLAYARGGKYQSRRISLNDFIEQTLPLIRPSIKPSIRLEPDLPPGILDVQADQPQLQIILSAILNNSDEAIDGEGQIKIRTRNMELDDNFVKSIPNLKAGRYVSLIVEDNGKGMDEATREKIFDPFFSTHFEGRGLSMAAVYGTVRNHNGWISVASEPGKGTTVKIYLPAIEVRKEDEQAKKPGPKADFSRDKGTILVIEDEKGTMKVTRSILERLGYRVLQARTGEEAVKLAKNFEGTIDLALLDIKLPDIGGEKLYPLIMEARPNLKVLVFSGYTLEGSAQEILNAGAEAFLQKPFTMTTLAEKVKVLLEGR